MEVDSVVDGGALDLRLKPRQNPFEMDWNVEQTCWTRSIKKSNSGFQVTVHF